jgi:hypothetical protein
MQVYRRCIVPENLISDKIYQLYESLYITMFIKFTEWGRLYVINNGSILKSPEEVIAVLNLSNPSSVLWPCGWSNL